MWTWALTSLLEQIIEQKKKRKMVRRYLISLHHSDLQFVITLKLNINEFWGFCEFLGKIDNISSHISPIATLLVPNTTNNLDLMGSFWSLWAKVWGNRKWLQKMATEKKHAWHGSNLLYSCKPMPQIVCHPQHSLRCQGQWLLWPDGLFPGCRDLLTSALAFSPVPGRGSSTFERLKWIPH